MAEPDPDAILVFSDYVEEKGGQEVAEWMRRCANRMKRKAASRAAREAYRIRPIPIENQPFRIDRTNINEVLRLNPDAFRDVDPPGFSTRNVYMPQGEFPQGRPIEVELIAASPSFSEIFRDTGRIAQEYCRHLGNRFDGVTVYVEENDSPQRPIRIVMDHRFSDGRIYRASGYLDISDLIGNNPGQITEAVIRTIESCLAMVKGTG